MNKKENGDSSLFISLGISIGSALGLVFGIVFDDIPLGLCFGVGAGGVIGFLLYSIMNTKSK